MAKAASAQKTNLFSVRVIRIRTNSDGTAKNEPNAHTSGSAYGTFFLNLYVKLNDIRLVFKIIETFSLQNLIASFSAVRFKFKI